MRHILGVKRKVGSTVNTFDRVIATLPDLSSMISKIYINEIEISKVKIGQIVCLKNRTKQIVLLGKSNEKNVIIEEGLETGTNIYLTPPEEYQKFRLVGENLISKIKEHK